MVTGGDRMKCTVIIDKEREPEVVVYAPERSETVLKIMAACGIR